MGSVLRLESIRNLYFDICMLDFVFVRNRYAHRL